MDSVFNISSYSEATNRLFISTLVLFSMLLSVDSHALTKEDCRTRVNNAMHNSDVLGGNEAERARWAQKAAEDCYREATQSGSGQQRQSSEGGGVGWLLFLGLLVAAYWTWYRPDINGFSIPFVGTPEDKVEKRSEAETIEDFIKEFEHTKSLRSDVQPTIHELTLKEISEKTESTLIDTVIWMASEKKICRDFFGISAYTLKDLSKLTGEPDFLIERKLALRGLKCREGK